ncbi:hypothetical protein AOC36_05350 [Erysipelothrix larvae]|uniref:Permease n=1 Tax=Erysipelothrix larvae TaxID=1514105 RepID=A0A0X8GZW2_9FIRM|nr:AI-2E family transporter [Erysipelothrix larvae]AMC93424.1 hypothetical protein AOC36_05350 [Erysipelothrix larvae]
MKIARKAQAYIEENIGFQTLITVLLILLVVYLLMLTSAWWLEAFKLIRQILFPFIIGFGFAYLVYPITRYLEKFKIPRAISVLVVMAAVIGLIALLFSAVIPNLIDDFALFGQTIVDSVQQLYNMYIESSDNPSDIIMSIYSEMLNVMTNITKEIPAYVTTFVTSALSILTTILFSFIIGIYFIFDYERFTRAIGTLARKVNLNTYKSLKSVDQAVKSYVRTEIVIMLIAFVEYTLVYFLVGHNYALILGVLTALSMMVPYIGPTIVHSIGILTSLTLGLSRAVILTLLLVVLSQVDGYVVAPMVFNKRDKLEPLWSLFSFFACSTLFGFVGILISMPLYFSVNSILKLRANNWNDESQN